MAQTEILNYHDYEEGRRHPIPWVKLDAPTKRKAFDGIHIGFEWEIECGGTNFTKVKAIAKALGVDIERENKLIAARDSSLTDGVELIGQPVNIGFMLNEDGHGYNLTAACKKADELGYVGQGDRNRGGHAGIHFNFGRDELNPLENAEHKMMCILLNNYEWLYKKFSRRETTADRWRYCPMPLSENEIKRITPMSLRTDYDGCIRRLQDFAQASRRHSVAINTSKAKVIEIRFMCSTTYPRYFLGAVQLMYMIAYAVRECNLEQITAINFPWFRQVALLNGFNEFIETCDANRVGVNELNFPV